MRRSPLPALVLLLVCLLAPGSGLAAAQPSTAAAPAARPSPAQDRLAGEDRFATAVAITQRTFPGGRRDVLLARADDFADALAAAAFASTADAPLLLTSTNTLPERTLAEIRRLGATRVLLLGGRPAIEQSVEAALRAVGLEVERIAGSDRYGTAAELARRVGAEAIGRVDGRRTAFLASGRAFPDALSVGPLAHAARIPVLLTPPDSLAPATAAVLAELGIERVIVLGGESAVSSRVTAQLGVPSTRLSGSDRTATAARIARFAVDSLGFTTSEVVMARGDAFPDALAAAAYAGRRRSPLLLAQSANRLGVGARDHLLGLPAAPQRLTALGGRSAVAPAVLAEADRAARGITYAFPVRPASAATYGRAHHDYPATDIFAACGTTVVAPTLGTVHEVSLVDTWNPRVNDGPSRGGLSVSIIGDDGVRYYGSHFERIEGAVRPGVRVQAGQVLGTVGRTGSAQPTPCHLHFGISPPCGTGDWQVRRGVVPTWPYLDGWKAGDHRSPVDEVTAWRRANAGSCPGT
jgi:peptidoglycan LD-endopeptidase LytH